MPKALVPLAQGYEDLEAVSILDVLRRGGFDVTSAGLVGGPITGCRQVSIHPDTLLDRVLGLDFDLIALPGGQPGTENLRADARIRDLLIRHHAQGAWIAAVCAAPRVLADAGLLRGKRFTCYPGALDNLAHGGTPVDAPVVVDGRLATGRSAGMALDFSLALVEALLGTKRRAETEEKMVRL